MSTIPFVLFHELGITAAEIFVIYFAGAGHELVGKGERVEVHVVLEVFEHEQALHRRFLIFLDDRPSARFEFDKDFPRNTLSRGEGVIFERMKQRDRIFQRELRSRTDRRGAQCAI
jgi:hypothetical protein